MYRWNAKGADSIGKQLQGPTYCYVKSVNMVLSIVVDNVVQLVHMVIGVNGSHYP